MAAAENEKKEEKIIRENKEYERKEPITKVERPKPWPEPPAEKTSDKQED